MTETIDSAAAAAPKKRAGGLNSMLLADLKAMANGMGISGAGSMKKAQLVDAIKAAQAGSQAGSSSGAAKPARTTASRGSRPAADAGAETQQPETQQAEVKRPEVKTRTRGGASRAGAAARAEAQPTLDVMTEDAPEQKRGARQEATQAAQPDTSRDSQGASRPDSRRDASPETKPDPQPDPQPEPKRGGQRGQKDTATEPRAAQHEQEPAQGQDRSQDNGQHNGPDSGGQQDAANDEEGRTGRNRRRRGRDRNRTAGAASGPTSNAGQGSGQGSGHGSAPGGNTGGGRNEPDTTILEDDVLVPAAGILDVLDNYAFVRTSGYLPGVDDVYVSLSMVRKFGLRRGDAIVGQVRQPREGERKEKFNPMVRIDNVNGGEPSQSVHRVEFAKLTPLSPSERLRLETGPDNLIGRVIDIAAPIGKGQRGLIVSPAKAGKTTILRSIANSITTNNPECHLMVVLLDERPEEVTDFERSVKGEVISSTFDRPAADHAMVAELAIERAKRLVELGHDVVVLVDGITRLGRAYTLSTPASGRVLSGGVDAAALHPPKRFFGAARNVENGGSLTILATAVVESGSKMDEIIFEEFAGTANMELRLRGELADKRLFPAIDAVRSGTRREELLMGEEEVAVVWKLRRLLAGMEGQPALELLLERLKKSQTNIEFLMQVQKSTPTRGED